MTLYEKNLQRTLNAVHLEKVDKVPFSYSGSAYVARRQGLKIAEFVNDYEKATQATIDFAKAHPGIDSIHSPIMNPALLTTLWFSKVKIPGIHLPDDELWQVDEQEVMKQEDYQKILDIGYEAWLMDYMVNKMDNPFAAMPAFGAASAKAAQRLAMEVGLPLMNGGNAGTPIEGFCGGRQLMNFFVDMVIEHDLVKAAMDKAFEHTLAGFKAQLANKPVGVWVGGWRAAPELMSHDTFMEFVWPYMTQLVDATVEAGVIPVLHFDSCWDSELETLKELPEKKCLLMLDGTTNMRKAREVLGDRMCLMGDVPSSMLAFGTADECYNYVTKLIDDIGPIGTIISSGCDVPLNARDENVDAIIQATLDYKV